MKTTKSEPEASLQTAPEPKYSIEKLRHSCMKLFGITQSTFDGAAHGLSGEFTVKEMAAVIAKWKSKEVR
jgi:hypothetical protein